MLNKKIPLHQYIRGARLVLDNAAQAEATALLETGTSDIIGFFQFDSHKIAQYFKRIALARGVKRRDAIVDEIIRDERGYTTHLRIGEESVSVDFLIDVSGPVAQGHRQDIQQPMALVQGLPADRPRHCISHAASAQKPGAGVTRVIAMNAGWMWQIALQERVDAGYVFSSARASEDNALQEMEKYLGFAIREPRKTLEFDSGCFEKV